MKKRKYFPGRVLCPRDIDVIVRGNKNLQGNITKVKTMSGVFFRVSPQTADEVFLLQTMELHREKFAPANGDGVIVTGQALHHID